MKKNLFQLAAILFFGSAVLDASANGLSVSAQDSFAAARGNAFAATADNASAIYYNPAGITQLSGTQFRAGLYGIYLDPTFQPPKGAPNANRTYSITKHYAFIPQMYLTHSFTNFPVSIGLGIYAPYGGSVNWPDNTGFRAVATHGSTTYLRINPVIAIKLCDQLSLGAGVSVDYARLELEQGLRPFAQPLVNDFRFTGSGWAADYNVGLLWKPNDYLSFGATVRGDTHFNLHGETEIEQQPFISDTTIPANADFEFPFTATIGFSVRPTPKWNLEFDVDYADWSTLNKVTIQQAKPPPFPVTQTIPVNLQWNQSWNYEIGVTRYFENGWHVSGGYVFSQNSVPDTYYSPLAADMDRHFFSLGLGRTGKTLDFDVTYQLGYGPPHTVRNSSPSSTPGFFAGQNANGTYKFFSQAVLISMGIHF